MSASGPEAGTEYSSPHRASEGSSGARARARWGPVALALAGAAALVVAELQPLLRLRTLTRHPVVVRTVQGGPHHGWALVPIAVLAALLALLGARAGSRAAAALPALLGLAALGIALGIDLPDAHATGLVGSPSAGVHSAQAHTALGLYLETLGGVLLLLAGAAGALLAPREAAGLGTPAHRETRGLPTARDRGLR